ncbi:MAG: response regulator [Verrucomicrobia bacterium]|nr:response regulator [Verrucomicrobiota bacterium]
MKVLGVVLPLVLLLGSSDVIGADQAIAPLPRVLVLNSYHAGYSWSDGELHGLQRVLLREYPGLIPDVEFLDGKRDVSPGHAQMLLEFILRRYEGVRFDLIVTLDDFALQFALAHRPKISPDTPIVFAGVNNYSLEILAGQTRVTGVTEDFDFDRCFELLRKLRPQSRTIHLICDSALGNDDTLAAFFRSAERFGRGLEFRQLRGWIAEDLPQRLAALPPGDAAFIIGIARDFNGRVISEDSVFIQEVARRSAVPIFMVNQPVLPVSYGYGWDNALWLGVGGAVLSSIQHGETAGALACRILRGEDMATIPVLTDSPSQVVFSYPQLIRHGIDTDLLPPGAEIFNRPYSFFRLYRARILTTLGVILLLSAAVVVLVVNNLRRHRAEVALRSSNERLQLLMTAIEQATELIALLSHDGTAFYANAAFTRVLQPVEPNQMPDTAALWRDASGNSFSFATVARAADLGRWQERISLFNNQGTAIILHIIVTPILAAAGEPTRYLFIAQDVTQETRLEEQVRLAQKMDAIGTLASGIAHDFNNILSAILCNTEIVLEDLPVAHGSREQLEDVRRATYRATSLVRQILTFSRHTKPRREVLSVTPILAEMLKFLRATTPVSVTLRHTVKSSPRIMADPTQLYQVALNLCTNAVQAIGSRDGLIEVIEEAVDVGSDIIVLHPELLPGPHLRLSVRDDGCGIPPEIVSRIFEPFFTTKERGQGTGLGLSVVHGIIRSHQAAISVYSSSEKGTVFHLYFPACTSPANTVDTPASLIGLPRGTGQQIVIVDDEASLTRMGALMLERLGYRCIPFVHPKAVLDYLGGGGACDLLVTDFSMPGLNAFELLTLAHKLRPELRAILTTGYLSESDRARAVEFAIECIVEKPLTTASLGRAVAEALAKRS